MSEAEVYDNFLIFLPLHTLKRHCFSAENILLHVA